MSWPDDIEAGLPAPEQNEPPALRRDIVDELSDHLQCALNRELLNHPDEPDPRSRVLARFGSSPQKLARQLWLDAMKETLMSNRLMLTIVVVLAAVCLTACGMIWTQSKLLQEMALQARDETQRLLHQREAASQALLAQNRELLAKLNELQQQPPAQSPGWNPLKVRVLLDGEEQTPAAGFDVEVNGKALSESEEIGLREKTATDGVANFGVVRPGQYRVTVMAPWGESETLYSVVRPGTEPVVEVVAPRQAPSPTSVRPSVEWPDALKGLDVAVVCRLQRTDTTLINERAWADGHARYLLIRQDGTMAEYGSVHSENYRANGFGEAADRLVTIPLTFYTDPTSLEGELPWRGKSAEVALLQLVKLSPQNELPTARGTLPLLSPSPLYSSAYWQQLSQLSGPRQREPEPTGQTFSIDNPDWKVSIPDNLVKEVIAGLSPDDYPGESASQVAFGTMTFLRSDKDGNGELSETEANESQRSHRIKFSEFPVTRQYFVQTYLEMRKSGSSSGFSRSAPSSGRSFIGR
ncbi:hypothetical protein GC176_08930 [bacterium]|nr:hypothetical protein [bacterium]